MNKKVIQEIVAHILKDNHLMLSAESIAVMCEQPISKVSDALFTLEKVGSVVSKIGESGCAVYGLSGKNYQRNEIGQFVVCRAENEHAKAEAPNAEWECSYNSNGEYKMKCGTQEITLNEKQMREILRVFAPMFGY